MSKMREESKGDICKENKEGISTKLVEIKHTLESVELKKDENLQYSHEILAVLIKQKFTRKTIIEKLKTVADFPTPYVFSKFALKAYENYDPQNDVYEQDLPEGWTLLTTANNPAINNGYFGVAYCNLKKQQVVVAHRGTSNMKGVWTDVNGVYLNYQDSQMNSASTFADQIVGILNELNKGQQKFQLFFTGHLLGGWLAQITTFTSKYLTIEGGSFLKAKQEGYHAHTVVFDSPGCKDMLVQLQDSYFLHHDDPNNLSVDILDITSYLSAPNRINTCNLHVGTIYRIFVDLSNINSVENNKKIPSTQMRTWTNNSNLVTHSMQRILEEFDQSTGQVRKDENGLLRIKEVFDWPISFEMQGEREYNAFFSWTKRFNKYDPDVKSETFQDELRKKQGLSPICYHVENLNWSVCRINVFTQDELLFLEKYQILRELPDSFKPKDFFCVVNDLVTEQNIKNVLAVFKIKDKGIVCKNEKELHKLIHYVKNIVNLFPMIKDRIEKSFTEDEIRKAIIESISLNNLVCKHFQHLADSEALEILINTQVLLLFVNEDTLIWLAIICKTLYETYDKEKVFIFNIKSILHFKKISCSNWMMNDFVDDILNNKSLLIFECKLNLNIIEEKIIIKNFFKCLFVKLNNKNIKVIIVARTSPHSSDKDNFEDIIKLTTCKLQIIYERKFFDSLTWFNFSDKFHKELAKRPVIVFQGQEEGTSLSKLIGDKAFKQFIASNADPNFLLQLINNKRIKINSKSPIFSEYDESCYIERKFIYQVEIKAEIFKKENNTDNVWAISGTNKETLNKLIPNNINIRSYQENDPDKEKIKFVVLDNPVDENFEKLCQNHPKGNIHMLKSKSNRLIWKKSQGALSELHKYIETGERNTKSYTEVQMLNKTRLHKVVIISDRAGMGKSTVLTRMSHIIRRQSPNLWVFRIDLDDYTKILKEIIVKNTLTVENKYKMSDVIDFLSNNLSETTPLKQALFRYYCQDNNNLSKMIVMFDGFDEISKDYKEIVLDIVQVLKESSAKQIWITTRPNMESSLKDASQQFAFNLRPFSKYEQVKAFTNFWNQMLDIHIEDQDRLQLFAKKIIKNFADRIYDTSYDFTGIPLQTRMIAEVFQDPCNIFLESDELMPEPIEKFKIFDLYEKNFKNKYNIYQSEKTKTGLSKPEINNDVPYEDFIGFYQNMALRAIFNEEISNDLINENFLQQFLLKEPQLFALIPDKTQLMQLLSEQFSKKFKSFIKNIKSGNHGTICKILEGKSHFMHRTFAEYLVAKFLIDSIKQPILVPLCSILKDILIADDYQIIRVFLNDQLETPLPDLFLSNNQNQNDCSNIIGIAQTSLGLLKHHWDCSNIIGIAQTSLGLLKHQNDCSNIIGIAINENNFNIIKLITSSLRKNIEIQKSFLNCTVDLFKNTVGIQIPKHADLLDNEGSFYYNEGNYNKAIYNFLESQKLKQLIYQDLSHQEVANSLNNLGVTYAKKGQYDQAIHYLKKSRKMQKNLTDQNPRHPNIAIFLNNLGSAYWNTKKYDQATKYYKQALSIMCSIKMISRDNLKVMTDNLVNLFAKRYCLNPCYIQNKISYFSSQEDFTKYPKHNVSLSDGTKSNLDQIIEYKLSLLFLPKNDSEAKLEIFTRIAQLTKEDPKCVELWFALAEGDSNVVARLLTPGANLNKASLISTNLILKSIVNRDVNNAGNEADRPTFEETPVSIAHNKVHIEASTFLQQNEKFDMYCQNANRKRPINSQTEKQDTSQSTKLSNNKEFYEEIHLEIEDQYGKLVYDVSPQQSNKLSFPVEIKDIPQKLNYQTKIHDISPETKKTRYDVTIKDEKAKIRDSIENKKSDDIKDLRNFINHDHVPFYFLAITNNFLYHK